MSNLKKIRVQHVDRNAKGVEIKTDVDVITDADCITMDDGDLRSGVKKMIDDRIGEVIDGAPEELDTLKELATELEKNQSGVSTILNKMNDKLEAKDLEGYAENAYVSRLYDDLKDEIDVSVRDSYVRLKNEKNEEHMDLQESLSKEIEKKVGKVDGKGLSTNDFTDVLKKKLDSIEDGAEKNKVTSVNGMTGAVTIEAGGGSVDLSGYAKTSDIKTKLSEMIDDSTHRTVTDEEKKEWSDQRSHTDNMISTMRSYVDTRLISKIERKDILNFKNCIVLSSDAYSKLSDEEKAKSDTLYFLK